MIEYYAYEGEDFHEDPKIPLLEGEEWDDRGKKDAMNHVFNFPIFILLLSYNDEMRENDLHRHWAFSSSWSIVYREASSGQRDGDFP